MTAGVENIATDRKNILLLQKNAKACIIKGTTSARDTMTSNKRKDEA